MNKTLLLPIVFASTTAFGQNWQPPVGFMMDCWPIHLDQLPPPEDATCIHNGTAHNVLEYGEIILDYPDPDENIAILEGECGVWECGQSPPIIMATCGYSTSSQKCWSVNGSISSEAKWALLVKLGIEIEVGASFY